MARETGWLVVIGIVLFIVLINAGMILNALRSRGPKQPPLDNRSLRERLNPWKDEDRNLAELRDHVSRLGNRDEAKTKNGR